jgi:NIMA-interacting peptidyl-prolyl cis-trans isomerase 1
VRQGGDLGWFTAGYMQQEFEDATLALAVDELSDVVATASGLHLIQRTG